jgi:hypothetical protein
MKRQFLSLFVLLAVAISASAQTRKDISVFIAPVAGPAEFAEFFHENFTLETIGAGYNVIDNEHNADYTLKLSVKPNMILYDDGTEEPPPPDEKQFLLQITLVKNEDNSELVTFDYAFTTTDEMYEFNLFLIYETMANVPMTKLEGQENDDRWRNKWLYLRVSFDYPITFYQLLKPNTLWGTDSSGQADRWHNLDHRISPFPAVTAGLEFQYLNWMSLEASFNLSFSDAMSTSFIPAIQIEQKFPIKPSIHFMIEPYAAVSLPVDTSTTSLQFPKVGLGGGIQIGIKAGTSGAFFVDINYIHYLGDVITRNESTYYPNPSEIHYSRFVIGLGIGYKMGFTDRKKT